MLGTFDNFPANIHKTDVCNVNTSSKQLQKNFIQTFYEINQKKFSFEEVANPTIPGAIIIFEFGLAENSSFCFINQQEAQRAIEIIQKERISNLDFYCAIQYHKNLQEKKSALKFDYYMIRAVFGKNLLELQIHHERGPRYLTPEDLIDFIFYKINSGSRKILTKTSF